MPRPTFSAVLSYIFFFALVGGLLALNYHAPSIVSYLLNLSYARYLPFALSPATFFYFSLALAFIITAVFWEKEYARESLQYSFLTIVTHKFRTPLSGIKWALGGLREEKTIEERRELLQEIENATERITQTVDTLTGLAKFNDSLSYAFEAVSLRTLVEQSMRKFVAASKERSVSFKLEPAPDVPLIVIDRQKVQFVIDVLLENAIKYSRQGGTVGIAIAKKGKFVLLAVSDDGIGLSGAEQAKIFNRFYRSQAAKEQDPDGMGLSLPLAHTVMRHHRGSISAHSRGKGKGATFVAKFPLR